jgi:hypothetical protein
MRPETCGQVWLKLDTRHETYQFHFLPNTKMKKIISHITVLFKLTKISYYPEQSTQLVQLHAAA